MVIAGTGIDLLRHQCAPQAFLRWRLGTDRGMKAEAHGSRDALRAVAHAFDGRGPQTALTDLACAYFHVTSPDDLTTAIYAPTITNERLAGFGRDVVNAAKDEDRVALKIVADGGTELGYAAVAVIRNLQMERDRFRSPTSAVFSEQQAI